MINYNHQIKVYYRDVDKMGIVYYSRYFEYFEEARTELLNSIGLDIISIEKNGIYLPVIATCCNFKKGLGLEQTAILKTTISDLPKSRLKINYLIEDKNSNKFYIKGYTEHAFMKKNGKPTKVPPLIISAIKKFI